MREMKNKYLKYVFDHHYTLLGEVEADEFVNWLMNDSGLSIPEIIYELEYQRNNPEFGYHMKEVCTNALKSIMVCCSQCGRTISYEDANWITTKYDVNKSSRIISRSIVGGSTVRRINTTYTPINECFCDDCLNENRKKYKEEKERNSIKGLFKRLFKRLLKLGRNK